MPLALKDPTSIWRIGSIVEAHRADSDSSSVFVPFDALTGDDEQRWAWRVNRGDDPQTGTVERVSVNGRISDIDGGLRINDSALMVNDEIVVRGVNSLRDGMSVGPRIEP